MRDDPTNPTVADLMEFQIVFASTLAIALDKHGVLARSDLVAVMRRKVGLIQSEAAIVMMQGLIEALAPDGPPPLRLIEGDKE